MHQGKVIAKYRERAGLTQEALAAEMGVHLRTVQRLEMTEMIRNTARRWFLVGLLGIPATSLGLEGDPPWTQKQGLPINSDIMAFFEQESEMRWHLYKTAGAMVVAQGLHVWIRQLQSFVEDCQGTPWHRRALAVLCMSYQLDGSILRDARAYRQAHTSFQQAWQVAQELQNPELLASTLLRKGMVAMAQERPLEALQYHDAALNTIKDLAFPRLRGKLLQAQAEACAMAQRSQDCWKSIGLATHILGREEESNERNQAIFSPSSVIMWKGLYSLMLHDYEHAITLFDKGLASHDPTLIPDQARFLSRKAEAYYGAKRLDECISTAQAAFTVANAVGATKTIKRVQSLHDKLVQSPWKQESGVKRLGAVLAMYERA